MPDYKKSLAVVGNAISIFDSAYGKDIDAHDEVVRFNKGISIIDKKSQGSKTDLLAVNGVDIFHLLSDNKKDVDLYNHNKFKILKFFDKDATALNTEKGVVDIFVNKYELFSGMSDCTASKILRFTTGFTFLYWLNKTGKLKTEYNKIDLYGFDFGKTYTYYNDLYYNTLRSRSFHNWEFEESYIKSLNTVNIIK